MNRREFWISAGGATAVSLLSRSTTLFAAEASDEETTPFLVKGLAMLSLGDPDYLRLALPKAPRHVATFSSLPMHGERTSHDIKGHGQVLGSTRGEKPNLRLPELIHVQELYRDAVSRIDSSPTIISIPWSAVRSVAAETLTEDRWTFVWKESGEEVNTFRPRRIAETMRIDLVSSGVLEMNDGDLSVDLGQVQEVSTDFVPAHEDMGDFTDHFGYYTPYFQTANEAEVAPVKVGRQTQRTVTRALGNSFASARMWPFYVCFPFRVD